MLQEIRGLAKDFHALSALEGSILAHHALVLMRVGQVRYIMATGTALMPSLTPDLQRGLLGRDRMLLTMLAMLGLLKGRLWLQDYSIHSTAKRVVGTLG